MKVRADVAELLRAGLPDRVIARQLHVHGRTVRAARRALHLPTHRPGPVGAATHEELFHLRTKPTGDGHLLWTNSTDVLRIGSDGPRTTARRVAFRIKYGREPVGHVRSGCGHPRCVHPDHVEDQAMRNQFTAIFGAAS